MTTSLKAHFDGKVLVPDGPVDLPVGTTLNVLVAPPDRDARPLVRLAELVGKLPDSDELPADGAAQHDHYLYGLPKKP